VTDSRIREWAATLAEREVKAFSLARRSFCRKPSARRLHLVRSAGRRLCSLYEDFADILPPLHYRRLRRLVRQAGEARDAAVLHRVLSAAVDDGERELIEPLLTALRERQRTGTRMMQRMLARWKRA